ncbi:peptidase C26 [Bordetella sp. H567]|uniref:gamma-glutamyl-gamma-aminobutyrate hydrolase family protein n=1 Tax=Bordetella sp. H567 TaxID=1697043 RepID=UPI00081C8DA9|nr:gamma-glutamyl-gamma-aminobutyrate hydrolase family protein [Bordetella sp. H567]AOB30842.1 peptidase C26 [Bordetella sp. H567]
MNTQDTRRPIVGVVCDRFYVGEHDLHSAKHSYIDALISVAGVAPVLIPATDQLADVAPYLDAVSGLLFPGGASNVEPARYGGPARPDMLLDRDRDHVAIALMQGAASRDMPILAICRGFQELNVAFGGTLSPDIYTDGYADYHREDPREPLEARYRFKHPIALTEGGKLEALAGAGTVTVNSLHMQGVGSLASPLAVEAAAPDGLVEAIRLRRHAFAIGVQWHPETSARTDGFSRALFEAFGAACRRHAAMQSQPAYNE